MRREISIRGIEDLVEARDCLRQIARDVGCDLVREAKLVAGLSDLAERFYLKGRAGRLVLIWDGSCLEARLEHEPVIQPAVAPCVPGREHGGSVIGLGGVRFMWDDVAIDTSECMVRVVLKSWPGE